MRALGRFPPSRPQSPEKIFASGREGVLFIGTQFSILYTCDTPVVPVVPVDTQRHELPQPVLQCPWAGGFFAPLLHLLTLLHCLGELVTVDNLRLCMCVYVCMCVCVHGQ